MKIKECDPNFRPREKALRLGLQSLSDNELICLLLGSGSKTKPVEQLAQDLLDRSGQLSEMMRLQPAQLMEIPGIGLAKAMLLCACVELARRTLQVQAMKSAPGSMTDIVNWFLMEYGTREQEHFAAVFLDSKSRMLRHKLLFIGTMNQSLIHPRDVFREACLCNASGVVLVHNHPSGDPTPSLADLDSTRLLCEAAGICGIEIVDHIIVGTSRAFSFRAHGLLDESEEQKPGECGPRSAQTA